jgi:hypothetical protein
MVSASREHDEGGTRTPDPGTMSAVQPPAPCLTPLRRRRKAPRSAGDAYWLLSLATKHRARLAPKK